MSRAMRRVAAASFVMLAAVAGWLTVQQMLAESRYGTDTRNARALRAADETARGRIVSADGVVVAEDVDGVRSYPRGADYLHLAGVSGGSSSTGLEDTRSSDLRSRDDGSISAWLVTLFGGSVEPPDLVLTAVDRVQAAAVDGLAGHTGAVVALDPATGAVLAYASGPTTDPNDLIGDPEAFDAYLEAEASLDRVAFRLLPSGSTFKVLVAAAALEQGFTTESEFEDVAEYLAPGAGTPITNVTGRTCSGGATATLREAITESCNTVFAALAVELGGAAVNGIAERAGFNAVLSFELGAAISSIPSAASLSADAGALAQTGLGERDVRVTPLQMALVAAALGNGGELMQPYVVDRVVSLDGSTLDTTSPRSLGRMVDPEVAAGVVSMMEDVVATGTGRAAAMSEVTVAGKTGTAEGAGGPHSWFIALAPAEAPTIAIAVVIEGEGTGGTVAAPIAVRLLRAWFDG